MEVPRLGVESELPVLPCATATAKQKLSLICSLHHSSWRRRILNPLSEARDQTRILMDTIRVCFCCAMTGTPSHYFLYPSRNISLFSPQDFFFFYSLFYFSDLTKFPKISPVTSSWDVMVPIRLSELISWRSLALITVSSTFLTATWSWLSHLRTATWVLSLCPLLSTAPPH